MGNLMERDKGQLGQGSVASAMIALALGGLVLMLWPGLFALFFIILLLFQSCTAEQEIAVWSGVWAGFCSYRPPLSSTIRPFGASSATSVHGMSVG